MSRNIDQKIAEVEAKLQRLKAQQRATETRRKIIVGSIVMTEAITNPKIAKWLADTLRKKATREVDMKELTGLLYALDEKALEA